MPNIDIIQMNNGAAIGLLIYELQAVPGVEAENGGLAGASAKNRRAWLDILNAAAPYAATRDVSLELLFATEPAAGQIYQAQTHMYLIARKYGGAQEDIQAQLESLSVSLETALASGGIAFAGVSWQDEAFAAVTGGIRGQSAMTVLRRERVQQSQQLGAFSYGAPLGEDGPDAWSGVFDALSRHPRAAVSLEVIPTLLTGEEAAWAEQLLQRLNYLAGAGQGALVREAMAYYGHFVENARNPLFMFGLFVLGEADACRDIAGKLQTSLQYEPRSGSGAEFISSPAQLVSTDLCRELPGFPWNAINYILSPAYRQYAGQPATRFSSLATAREAAGFFRTPVQDGSITGVQTSVSARVRDRLRADVISPDNIQFGRPLGVIGETGELGASLKRFTRHALVVGMPGTGKTTFSVKLLLQFHEKGIPFLAIEPTKSEYRAMIDAVEGLQVFTPGKNDVTPFVLNPFLPPRGISLETFKPSLVSAFKAAFSMPSPLDILFQQAVDECYTRYGWRSYTRAEDPEAKPFGLAEFIGVFRDLIERSSYSGESKGNLRSAGVFRLMNLITQNPNIYDTIHSVPIEDLLRQPTVIELNAIDNQEQKALLMALLLIHIVLYTKHNQAGDGKLKNIILIDEAHVLLDAGGGSGGGENSADASGSTVRALQNMIVEIRSYGTGIIIADQSPQRVTRPIVGNTDIKVSFRLVDPDDRRLIAESTNMAQSDYQRLPQLGVGEAFVSYDGLAEPQLIKASDIRDEAGIRLVVPDGEVHDRVRYWDGRETLLRPYAECEACAACRAGCDFRLREDARFYADRLYALLSAHFEDKLSMAKLLLAVEKFFPNVGLEAGNPRLKGCVKIRLLRRAQLEAPFSLNPEEVAELLKRWAL